MAVVYYLSNLFRTNAQVSAATAFIVAHATFAPCYPTRHGLSRKRPVLPFLPIRRSYFGHSSNAHSLNSQGVGRSE